MWLWIHPHGTSAELSLTSNASPSVGDGAVIQPPFYCDYGFNISISAGAFLNFNCVILNVVAVSIGDGTQIGPAVQILAADHPRKPRVHSAG